MIKVYYRYEDYIDDPETEFNNIQSVQDYVKSLGATDIKIKRHYNWYRIKHYRWAVK